MTRPTRTEAGFTLLEVMISLAILGLSLTAISRSQLASVRAANRAKMMTVATMLARYKMMEVEDELFEEGFSDFKEEEKKSFKEEGFERFSYKLVVDKVELPANLNAEGLADAVGAFAGDMAGGSGKGSGKGAERSASADRPGGGMASMAAGMIGKQLEMVRNILEQSIRRVQLSVEWKEGKLAREVTVVAYFTDPRKIDAALGGGLVPEDLDKLLKKQPPPNPNNPPPDKKGTR